MLRRRNFMMLALLTAALMILPLRAADLPYAAPEKLGLSTERLARLDAVINDYIAKERVAGTVSLILRNGKIAYYKAQGMKDRGKVMPKLVAELKGKADGRVINEVVSQLLG